MDEWVGRAGIGGMRRGVIGNLVDFNWHGRQLDARDDNRATGIRDGIRQEGPEVNWA